MRKKLMPDIRVRSEEYQPKGSSMAPPVRTVPTPTVTAAVAAPIELGIEDSEAEQQSGAEELDFEVVDPDEPSAIEEDKNRKVLRSLEHGDTVVDVFNVSRIVGLDAHGQSPFVDMLILRGPTYSRQGEYLPHRPLLPEIGSGDCGRLGCADGGT
jgi:hypothetical protein